MSIPQKWPAYNAAQSNEKEHFEVLLRNLCDLIPEEVQASGRARIALADMVFACVTKVYTTVP